MTARAWCVIGAGCCLLLGLMHPALVSAAEANSQDAAAQLRRVEARIRAVTDAVKSDVAQRDTVAAALQSADQALGYALTRGRTLHTRRVEIESQRGHLQAQRAQLRARQDTERAGLAADVRSAYATGPQEELQVLLNAEDPATLGRMLSYYGYLGRARAKRIGAISVRATQLKAMESTLKEQESALRTLELDEHQLALAADSARAARLRALTQLKERIQTGSDELKTLKSNAAVLENLLSKLRTALVEPAVLKPTLPPNRRPFEVVRGQLPWPAQGSVRAAFGAPRAGGLNWNGLLMNTHSRGEVHALYFGRVIYADWLPGLGLLLIIDHGDGYLSLYGYNDRLQKNLGDSVIPGEVIATSPANEAARSELYFEIRQGAHPLDPKLWLAGLPKP